MARQRTPAEARRTIGKWAILADNAARSVWEEMMENLGTRNHLKVWRTLPATNQFVIVWAGTSGRSWL